MQILLQDIHLYGYHGVTTLENRCGTQFKVNMSITLKKHIHPIGLADTVDYVRVFQLLTSEFNKTTALLEELADRILVRLFEQFPEQIDQAEITVLKVNPAVQGFQGSLGVRSVKTSTT